MKANIERKNIPTSTSDHTWRSYVTDFYDAGKYALEQGTHRLRVRIATWNMGDRFKQLTITDHKNGEVRETFNNPWQVVENDQEYLVRKRKQFEIITQQIMKKADVITLQEADILSCLSADSKVSAQEKALVTEFQGLWKTMGYEILPISRKVSKKEYPNFKHPEGERDGWVQHLAIIYNSKLMQPSMNVSAEPLFPSARLNKDKESFTNYRGVGQEFTLLRNGRPTADRFFVFSMHLEYNVDNHPALQTILNRKGNHGVYVLGAGDTNTTPGHREHLKLVNPHYASSLERVEDELTIIDRTSGAVRALDGPVAGPTARTLVVVAETGGEAFLPDSLGTFTPVRLENINNYWFYRHMSEPGTSCLSTSAYNEDVAEKLSIPPANLPSGSYLTQYTPTCEAPKGGLLGFFEACNKTVNGKVAGQPFVESKGRVTCESPKNGFLEFLEKANRAVPATEPQGQQGAYSSENSVQKSSTASPAVLTSDSKAGAQGFFSAHDSVNNNYISHKPEAHEVKSNCEARLRALDKDIDMQLTMDDANSGHNIRESLNEMRIICRAAGWKLEEKVKEFDLKNTKVATICEKTFSKESTSQQWSTNQ